jgi:hypothetical protein
MNRPSLWLSALSFLFAAFQGQGSVYGGERAKYCTMLEDQVKDTAFVKFLRDRGTKMETDANGLLRIYVRGTPEIIPAVVKFLGLMKTRMGVIAENLANVDTISVRQTCGHFNVNPLTWLDLRCVAPPCGNNSIFEYRLGSSGCI